MAWNLVDSQQWFVVAAVFGLAEAGLQLWVLAASEFSPTGDEVEYIQRGRAGRSFGSDPFLRVPFLPAVAWLCGRTGQTTLMLRLASILCSVVAVAATAGAAARLGGWGVATMLCLLLLLIPERIALGSRIWPDVYLAAVASTIVLILALTPSPIGAGPSAALVGALLAAAVLIRLDALILIPSVAIVWSIVSPVFTPVHACWLIGLPLAAFAAWWLVAAAVLDQRWPDTTWIFNLGITAQEARVQQTGTPIAVDDLIQRHQSASGELTTEDQQPERLDRGITPWTSFLLSVASRIRALVGPDTFVRGKILADTELEGVSIARSVLNGLYRISVPLMVATTLVIFVWRPHSNGWPAVPALALMIPAILFHARTRFRLPLIYGLVPVLAASLGQILSQPQALSTSLIIVALVGLLTLMLSRSPRRLERR